MADINTPGLKSDDLALNSLVLLNTELLSVKTLDDTCTFDITSLLDSMKYASNSIAYDLKVPIYNAIKILLAKIDTDPTDTTSIKNLTDLCNLLNSKTLKTGGNSKIVISNAAADFDSI